MRTSTDRILTTHVGSLPGRANVLADDKNLRQIVSAQTDVGIDIKNEGEFTKGGDWLGYMEGRLGGFQPNPAPQAAIMSQGKDREEFADFYRHATERGLLFYDTKDQPKLKRTNWVCSGPITYQGQATMRRAIDAYRAAIPTDDSSDYFLTTTAPASLEPYYAQGYYSSSEEFLYAMAGAMREEYELIANAGFIVQIDDAWLVALWDRIGISMGLSEFKKFCMLRVEALNFALSSIPEDRIRYHLCWGSWHGPHAYDIPLRDVVDVLLNVKAQGYSIEGANARHEHEYHVWESVKLPENKILLPGVVAHSTDVVEHPELVSERIQRYARLIGKERVIASTDCGFGERTHPQIAWAKMRSLAEGAALASKALYR